MPTPIDLTDKQWDVLEFIRDTTMETGRPPSVREIGLHFDIKSPNGVMCHLKALQKKGYLIRDKMLSRGSSIVVPEGHCKACGQKLPGVKP